jgi:hypothetical protein
MAAMASYFRRPPEHVLVVSRQRSIIELTLRSVKSARDIAVVTHARHNNINTFAFVCASIRAGTARRGSLFVPRAERPKI